MRASVTVFISSLPPYDFKGTRNDNPIDPRTFIWTYTWKSTTGNLSDLASVLIYEHIEYPGGNATTPYTPPSPFIAYTMPHNPGDIHMFPQDTGTFHASGSAGTQTDGHADSIRWLGYGSHNYAGTYTVNQEYRWYLPSIHDKTVNGVLDTTGFDVLKGAYGPMHSIVRTVVADSNGKYRYTITKHYQTLTWIFDPSTDL